MKGMTRRPTMKRALIAPSSAARGTAARSAAADAHARVAHRKPAISGARYMTDPTERSIPAVSSTKVMPTAAMPMKAACLTMLPRFRARGTRRAPRTEQHDGEDMSTVACRSVEVGRGGDIMPPLSRKAAAGAACFAVERRREGRDDSPRLITRMRSHRPMSSSSSDEMTRSPAAAPPQAVGDGVDLVLGPHVDAARRLVEDEEPRVGGQPLADHHLLLVAARERLHRLAGEVLGLEPNRLARPRDRLDRARGRSPNGPRASARCAGSVRFSAIVASISSPSSRRFSVTKASPWRDPLARAAGEGRVAEARLAAGRAGRGP